MASTDAMKDIMDKYGVDSYANSSSKTSSKGKNDLSKDAFLNLLVTQLQYQDPLNPTEDKDFLAQMAQFSSLEQMQNLNTSNQMTQGYDLIGKVVTATITDASTLEPKTIQGFAESVILKSGKPYLMVGEQEVELSQIISVTSVDYDSASITSINKINETLLSIQEQLEKLLEDRNPTDEPTDDETEE